MYAGYTTRELFVAGNGPPIVFLHGFGDSADTWQLVLELLADGGRMGVAVDLPGFGEADSLKSDPIMPQLDAFVADVVRRYGIGQSIILVGNSLGALLAVRAAGDPGLPIRGLLSIAAAGLGWTRLLSILARRNLALVALLARLPCPSSLSDLAVALVGRTAIYGRWSAADPVQMRRFKQQLDSRPALATALALLPEVNAVNHFDAVKCPTTVLQGRRDKLVPMAAAWRLHEMIPHSQVVALPNAGHCPQLDSPAYVAALATELATAAGGDECGGTG
ncbi:alpha/beta fold hydrolase [Mycolicibacterium mucogenicum]|uniref:alpha/beta fold hydrolase n=1 Tax=Mycolicibacterium mucogenicum TaxID=56689 RepID=UPI0009F41853|nr:alpha/beta hydrolase [Mycolicibacterium mucogenicum]